MQNPDPMIHYLQWFRQSQDPRKETFACLSVESLPDGGTKSVIFGGQRTEWRDKEGQLHRQDGPAIEDTDGYKSWWIHGEKQETQNV